jgi:peptide deformylase
MKLPLAYYGDPILRQKAKRVEAITPEIDQLVRDMFDTMIPNNGWALAAPQVHRSLALFIMCIPRKEDDGSYSAPDGVKIYINPKIIWKSEELMTIEDGCLSIPEIRGRVSRSYRIKIEATDMEGNRFEEELWDYEAYGAQHEMDHLEGIFFIDRMDDQKERQALESKLAQIQKKYYEKN